MDLTEQELFDAATSAAPMQEMAEEPAQPEQTAETARDEKGRFAPKAADDAAPEQIEPQPNEQAAPEQPAKQGFVPSSRLKVEADARRAEKERADRLEQMLAQLVQQQAKPATPAAEPALKADFWEAPDQWVDSHLGTVKSEVQQTREFFSRRLAEQMHGVDKVNEAYSALDKAITAGQLSRDEVVSKLSRSMDPYGDILNWYESTAPQRDPESYKQKIIAEYLASQKAEQAAPAAAAPARSGPAISLPSLSKVGATSLPSRGGTEDDAALWEETTRRKR